MFKVLYVGEGTIPTEPLEGEMREDLLWEEVRPGEDLEEELVNRAPDLVLLEVRDPSVASRALEILEGLRRERPIPLLILGPSALLEFKDLLLAADEFLIEPYDLQEMTIRIEKVLQRTYSVEGRKVIRCGDLMIDVTRRKVTLNGELLPLTFKEYELLKFLAANRGRVFTREALLNKIWGYDYYGGERTVDVHIRRLRAKIEGGGRNFIETVRGVGYRFREGP